MIRILNQNRQLTAELAVRNCASFQCRLLGLMFRSRLDQGGGILLVQKNDSRIDSAIHMFFVFMDLAVIWIDSEMNVVDTVLAKAWRPFYAPRQAARFILEIHPARLQEFSIGDHVEFLED